MRKLRNWTCIFIGVAACLIPYAVFGQNAPAKDLEDGDSVTARKDDDTGSDRSVAKRVTIGDGGALPEDTVEVETIRFQRPTGFTFGDKDNDVITPGNGAMISVPVKLGNQYFRIYEFLLIENDVGSSDQFPVQITGDLNPNGGPGGGSGGTEEEWHWASTVDEGVGVEVQVHQAATDDDDYVQLKSAHPSKRYKTACRVRLSAAGASDITVVLTSKNDRLRFPENETKTIALPKNGDWVDFEVSGELGSNAKDDAVIVVRKNSASGILLEEEEMTVFHFDQASLSVTPDAKYVARGGSWTSEVGKNAVNYEMTARIRPTGVDCMAPQIKDLMIGMSQAAQTTRTITWDTPAITWDAGVAGGTMTAAISPDIRLTVTVAGWHNDTAGTVAPIYDQPGKADTLDANSLRKPTGCVGAGVATTFDTPSPKPSVIFVSI